MTEEIIVVSGLPRSGTSMMMQMLGAGGLPVLTDQLRKPDSNNPSGYLEYEPVKKLAADNSWMDEAKGKCVKIIAQLIPYVHLDFSYKILFMNRPVDEVLQSQQILLGKDPRQINPVLSQVFSGQVKKVLEWMDDQPNISYRIISYQDVIDEPVRIAEEVNSFLALDLQAEKMALAVDPQLYRNKAQ